MTETIITGTATDSPLRAMATATVTPVIQVDMMAVGTPAAATPVEVTAAAGTAADQAAAAEVEAAAAVEADVVEAAAAAVERVCSPAAFADTIAL